MKDLDLTEIINLLADRTCSQCNNLSNNNFCTTKKKGHIISALKYSNSSACLNFEEKE